jgi:hypothetical protein
MSATAAVAENGHGMLTDMGTRPRSLAGHPMTLGNMRSQRRAVAGRGGKRKKVMSIPIQPADPFVVLRPRLQKALVGLSRELPNDWHEGTLITEDRPPREQFPVPELVLFALRNVLGFHTSAHGEKSGGRSTAHSMACWCRSSCENLDLRSVPPKAQRRI